jgi:hypothetical protein
MGSAGRGRLRRKDFESALTWSRRRLNVIDEISDPDHVADIYESAIPSFCANADSPRQGA